MKCRGGHSTSALTSRAHLSSSDAATRGQLHVPCFQRQAWHHADGANANKYYLCYSPRVRWVFPVLGHVSNGRRSLKVTLFACNPCPVDHRQLTSRCLVCVYLGFRGAAGRYNFQGVPQNSFASLCEFTLIHERVCLCLCLQGVSICMYVCVCVSSVYVCSYLFPKSSSLCVCVVCPALCCAFLAEHSPHCVCITAYAPRMTTNVMK